MRGTDLARNITGVHLIHNILERRDLVFSLVAVHQIVDGDKADIVVGEENIRVMPDGNVISAETGQILDHDDGNIAHFNIIQQCLKTGTVEIGAGVTVVHVVFYVLKTVFFCLLLQHFLLIADGIALTFLSVVTRKAAVKSGNANGFFYFV